MFQKMLQGGSGKEKEPIQVIINAKSTIFLVAKEQPTHFRITLQQIGTSYKNICEVTGNNYSASRYNGDTVLDSSSGAIFDYDDSSRWGNSVRAITPNTYGYSIKIVNNNYTMIDGETHQAICMYEELD